MKSIDSILRILAYLLLLINTILFTYNYLNRNKSKAVKYLTIYLALSFCFSITSKIVVVYHEELNIEKSNLFLTHFFFISQFIFLSLFYNLLFTKKQKYYQLIISVLVFLVLLIQYSTNTNLFNKFNLLEILITSLPLIIYSIFHLYNSLGKRGKFMYVNAGVLVYLSVSTLVFILGNLLNTIDRSLSSSIWFLNRLFYVGYLILFLIEWKKSLWRTVS